MAAQDTKKKIPFYRGMQLGSDHFSIDNMKDYHKIVMNGYLEFISSKPNPPNPIVFKNDMMKLFLTYKSHFARTEKISDEYLKDITKKIKELMDHPETNFAHSVQLFVALLSCYIRWQDLNGYIHYDLINNGYDFPLLLYGETVISDKDNNAYVTLTERCDGLYKKIQRLQAISIGERETLNESILVSNTNCKIWNVDKDADIKNAYRNSQAEIFVHVKGIEDAYNNGLIKHIVVTLRDNDHMSVFLVVQKGVYNMTVLRYYETDIINKRVAGGRYQEEEWERIRQHLTSFYIPFETQTQRRQTQRR